MGSKIFEEVVNRSPKDSKIFVSKALDMSDALYTYMNETNTNQKELADKLGKKESEISRWLQGMQNFTFKTVSKIEAVLGVTFVHVSRPVDITNSLMNAQIKQGIIINTNSNAELDVMINSNEVINIVSQAVSYKLNQFTIPQQ